MLKEKAKWTEKPEKKWCWKHFFTLQDRPKNRWCNMPVTQCAGDSMCRWPNALVTQCAGHPMCQWPNAPVTQCAGDSLCRWPNAPVTQCALPPKRFLAEIGVFSLSRNFFASQFIWIKRAWLESRPRGAHFKKNNIKIASLTPEISPTFTFGLGPFFPKVHAQSTPLPTPVPKKHTLTLLP